jgi:ParB family chromosome partitioning protein
MTKIRPGLGRGLDALINPKLKEEVDSAESVSMDNLDKDDGKSLDILVKIPVDQIVPNPYQPRASFDADALEELKKSILENGLIQPITVSRIEENRYQLVSGERRLRSCKDIGYREIPAYIIKIDSKETLLALSLIENIQREKLNTIEIANAYKRLMEECNLSQEEIAIKVGKDRTTVTNTIRLLKLPSEIQESIVREEISPGHARTLINLPSEALQIEVLEKIKRSNLSVRKVENLVKKFSVKVDKTEKPEADSKEGIFRGEIEEKLRGILGTKVICKQRKDGAGNITIEFYSNDELERLFELFDIIEKNNY